MFRYEAMWNVDPLAIFNLFDLIFFGYLRYVEKSNHVTYQLLYFYTKKTYN